MFLVFLIESSRIEIIHVFYFIWIEWMCQCIINPTGLYIIAFFMLRPAALQNRQVYTQRITRSDCVFMSDFQVSGSSMAFSKASWQLISANKEPLAVKHLVRLSNRKKNTRSIFVPRQVCKRKIGK